MTIEELHRTVVEGFQRIDGRLAGHDQRFVAVDQRFVGIDERFARMDERFDRMDERFDRMDGRFDRMDERFDRMDERFERVDAEFVKVREEMRQLQVNLEARMREESETTRRHFNVVAERIEAMVRIVAEGHGHLQSVVENHEQRFQTIEKRL